VPLSMDHPKSGRSLPVSGQIIRDDNRSDTIKVSDSHSGHFGPIHNRARDAMRPALSNYMRFCIAML
jgi:hypothetical protein